MRIKHFSLAVVVLSCGAVAAVLVRAAPPPPADRPAPRAARSVHLHYPAPEATLFYNEATVEESQDGTYFCACGFGHGYFGIQQKRNADDKVVIFSVWEPHPGDDPKAVPADRRVDVTYHADDVTIGRFGGEGTGGQSFYKYPWKVGETSRFLVRAESDAADARRTAYSAYFYRNDVKQWKHLATMTTIAKGDKLKGLYSFVEDFRRDGKSPNQRRVARYGNGWAKTVGGDWVSLARAKFTGDDTPLDNVDAAVADGGFRLATGGETANTTKIGATLARPPGGVELPDFGAP